MKIYEFLNKISEIIEEEWPHLRHSLRGEIEIDGPLKKRIINIIEEDK